MEINKDEFKIWMDALRSGDFPQTYGHLHDSVGYCCLGVACAVLIPKDKLQTYHNNLLIAGEFPYHQKYAPQWLKDINNDFFSKSGKSLIMLNDRNKLTFNQIADILEQTYFPNGNQ